MSEEEQKVETTEAVPTNVQPKETDKPVGDAKIVDMEEAAEQFPAHDETSSSQ